MVGLNVTRSVRLTRDRIAEIRAMGTDVATTVADLLTYFIDVYESSFGSRACSSEETRRWLLLKPPQRDSALGESCSSLK